MYYPSWKQRFAATVLLLGGAFAAPTVQAQIIMPTELDGAYAQTNLGNQAEMLPVNFQLTGGVVEMPLQLTGFTVPDLNNVSIDASMNVSLGTSNFTLSGGILGTINYQIDSSSLFGSSQIDSDITLISNTTSIDMSNLTSAMLVLSFPPADVSFDPHWAGFSGPVTFQIVAVPEPASMVHLMWVGVFGVAGYWWRHRRAPRAVAA